MKYPYLVEGARRNISVIATTRTSVARGTVRGGRKTSSPATARPASTSSTMTIV
jgi:hypothetical protein